ncbi:hypothetical protein ACNTMW_27400 [Planosporangium sp. 12N6]|uniref:hypothetical protein n=1 Tax=Planosporangium spinosum TaxID=3402278 RepID=UPI003CF325FF
MLLAHRRAGARAGRLPWAALAAGTAANVAVGGADPVGRLVADWPAVALLVSIKLLSGLPDAAPSGTAMGGTSRDETAGPGSLGPVGSVPDVGTGSGPDQQDR